MRFKVPRWKAIAFRTTFRYAFCSALLFPGAFLHSQEVRQDTLEDARQDVKQLQEVVRELRQEVRKLQEEIRGLRQGYFPEYGEYRFDSVSAYTPHRFIHRLGIEARPQYVFPTNPFLRGENERWKPIQTSFAAHLKYSFKFRPNTCADRIYGGAYQGFGLGGTYLGGKKKTRFRLGCHYLWRQETTR